MKKKITKQITKPNEMNITSIIRSILHAKIAHDVRLAMVIAFGPLSEIKFVVRTHLEDFLLKTK